jgi:hypothetical protein
MPIARVGVSWAHLGMRPAGSIFQPDRFAPTHGLDRNQRRVPIFIRITADKPLPRRVSLRLGCAKPFMARCGLEAGGCRLWMAEGGPFSAVRCTEGARRCSDCSRGLPAGAGSVAGIHLSIPLIQPSLRRAESRPDPLTDIPRDLLRRTFLPRGHVAIMPIQGSEGVYAPGTCVPGFDPFGEMNNSRIDHSFARVLDII